MDVLIQNQEVEMRVAPALEAATREKILPSKTVFDSGVSDMSKFEETLNNIFEEGKRAPVVSQREGVKTIQKEDAWYSWDGVDDADRVFGTVRANSEIPVLGQQNPPVTIVSGKTISLQVQNPAQAVYQLQTPVAITTLTQMQNVLQIQVPGTIQTPRSITDTPFAPLIDIRDRPVIENPFVPTVPEIYKPITTNPPPPTYPVSPPLTPIIPIPVALPSWGSGGGGAGGSPMGRGRRKRELFSYAPTNLKILSGPKAPRQPAVKKAVKRR
jgi:hypothetical protein